ncbi:uncharacterized protein LOC119181838 isoform X2 [Rhipicephalus microplus]
MRSRIGGLALTIRTAAVLCLVLEAGAMAVPQARELPTLRDVQFWNKPPVHSRNEQCPQGEDTVTFEKMVAMKPGSRRLSPMFAPREDFRSRGAVTLDCLRRCQASPRCLGVVVNYEHNACFAATALDDEDVANTLGSATDQPNLVPASDRSNYFAKMCVHGPACDKDWVMERVPDKELRGFDDRVVSGVPSCQRCQELCLHESSFPCRSGEFDGRARECRLSSQDRRSQPSSFVPAQGPHVHYFENLCLPPSSGQASNCDYELHKDVDLRRADQVRSAFSADQCRSLCETSREFACRSYSFAPAAGVCAMSGDDTVSLGGFALRMTPGVGYYQRPACPEPVQLSCTRESMALTLHTKDPFAGRIYPRDEASGCDIQGRGSRETTLVMGLMDRRCGVSEDDRGRFTSTIVIQQHPVIQQKGDRIVKLFCIFDTGNRTVTNTYKVLVGGAGPASRLPGVVNATAPAPNVRLRITDRAGVDVAGAKLGDELFLRIEMDDDSVFGLFARNLVATSGQNDDSIVLIDSSGCPTDKNIFPALEKLPGDKTRTLQSRFEAFKFADDVVVRFQPDKDFSRPGFHVLHWDINIQGVVVWLLLRGVIMEKGELEKAFHQSALLLTGREPPPQLIARVIDLDSRFLTVTVMPLLAVRNNQTLEYVKFSDADSVTGHANSTVNLLHAVNRLLPADRQLTADDRMVVKNKFILPFVSDIVLGEHSGSETAAGYVAFLVALQLAPAMSSSYFEALFPGGTVSYVVRLVMCLVVPNQQLSYAMVDLFVDWFVEDDKLAAIRAMSTALWRATESIITDLSWIDEATRKRGLERIRRLGRVVGHPFNLSDAKQELREHYAFVPKLPASHADMFTTLHDAYARRRLALLKATEPSVRREDPEQPMILVNAFYVPIYHWVFIMDGIMFAPFYTLTVPDSVNYGALGHVVGHEVTHSFDPVLGVFNASGQKDDWWSPDSRKLFDERIRCLRNLYNAVPWSYGVRYGDSALSENFADCGGMEKVMRALRDLGPQPDVTLGEHRLTAQQAFFVSSCFKWCSKYVPKPAAAGEKPDEIAQLYSPLNMRCNVPLMNTPAFADAFDCAPGTIMSPKVRCELF